MNYNKQDPNAIATIPYEDGTILLAPDIKFDQVVEFWLSKDTVRVPPLTDVPKYIVFELKDGTTPNCRVCDLDFEFNNGSNENEESRGMKVKVIYERVADMVIHSHSVDENGEICAIGSKKADLN